MIIEGLDSMFPYYAPGETTKEQRQSQAIDGITGLTTIFINGDPMLAILGRSSSAMQSGILGVLRSDESDDIKISNVIARLGDVNTSLVKPLTVFELVNAYAVSQFMLSRTDEKSRVEALKLQEQVMALVSTLFEKPSLTGLFYRIKMLKLGELLASEYSHLLTNQSAIYFVMSAMLAFYEVAITRISALRDKSGTDGSGKRVLTPSDLGLDESYKHALASLSREFDLATTAYERRGARGTKFLKLSLDSYYAALATNSVSSADELETAHYYELSGAMAAAKSHMTDVALGIINPIAKKLTLNFVT
jgi:hypothetical protein